MPINEPRISVVIPLYNHEKYIAEAVYSVLGQSFTDFELIVINDGSSDSSENVIKEIKDDRIRYFFQDNRGAPHTLNKGIQLARGEYVSVLNSDDIYDPKRLEECFTLIESDRSLSAVFSHLEFIDAEGNFIKYLRGAEENWTDHTPETSFKGENNIVLDLLAGNFLTTTSNLFCRKTVFDSLGNFSDLRYAHDYDFFLRLCYHHDVYLVEKPLLKYRIHRLNTVKEDEAAVQYEVGLVLTNFFLNSDFCRLFSKEDDVSKIMTKFFNSVKTGDAERMILTLLVFCMKYPDVENWLSRQLLDNTERPFRPACINQIEKKINDWRTSQELWNNLKAANEEVKKWWLDSQEAWNKVAETGDKLMRANEETKKWWLDSQEAWNKTQELRAQLDQAESKLAKAEDSLAKTTGHLTSVINSRSFRLGRALTWPLRKLLGRI